MGDLAPLYFRDLLNYKDLHSILTCGELTAPAAGTRPPQDVTGSFLPSISREDKSARLSGRRATQSRMDVRPLTGNRHYTSIATQDSIKQATPNKDWTEEEDDLGLPSIHPTMLSYDEPRTYDVGTQSARLPAGNNFYQRLLQDGRGYQTSRLAPPQTAQLAPPQTARPAPPEEPRAVRQLKEEPGPPIFRAGRMGAPWRHVRQCLGNLGNHICFVDGYVKEHDVKYYPPFGYKQAADPATYISPRLNAASDRKTQPKYGSMYSSHAKKGFKYWHEDKPTASCAPKQTIQGRLMKTGIGY